MHAGAQQHRQVFPDGYYPLTPEELAPIPNARSAEEILAGAPRGPGFDGEPLSAAERAADAARHAEKARLAGLTRAAR